MHVLFADRILSSDRSQCQVIWRYIRHTRHLQIIINLYCSAHSLLCILPDVFDLIWRYNEFGRCLHVQLCSHKNSVIKRPTLYAHNL